MNTIEDHERSVKKWARDAQALSFASVAPLENDVSRQHLFPPRFNDKTALDVLRTCQVYPICIAPGRIEIRVGLKKTDIPTGSDGARMIRHFGMHGEKLWDSRNRKRQKHQEGRHALSARGWALSVMPKQVGWNMGA